MLYFPHHLLIFQLWGTNLTFDNLTVSFIVDEFLENYLQLHSWLYGIGFPKNRQQFRDFRGSESVTPTATQGVSDDIGDVKPPLHQEVCLEMQH